MGPKGTRLDLGLANAKEECMDISVLLEQIFAFILQLLELVFGFAGGSDDDDEEDDD